MQLLAFFCVIIILLFFILIINADVIKFVINPLEAMFEKV